MKKLTALMVSLLFFGMFLSRDASALGLGFYVEGGGGSGELTIDPDIGSSYDVDVDVGHGGIGFALDTSVLDKSVFNYRLNVGFESLTFEPDSGGDLDLNGIVMMHDFGFAIVRNKKLRFWGGPEIKIGFYSGEDDNNEDVNLVSFGLGPALGLNLRLSSSVFLTLKGGFLFTGYGGDADTYTIDEGSATVAFFNAGLLFE